VAYRKMTLKIYTMVLKVHNLIESEAQDVCSLF